jgi:hypothetical protein
VAALAASLQKKLNQSILPNFIKGIFVFEPKTKHLKKNKSFTEKIHFLFAFYLFFFSIFTCDFKEINRLPGEKTFGKYSTGISGKNFFRLLSSFKDYFLLFLFSETVLISIFDLNCPVRI